MIGETLFQLRRWHYDLSDMELCNYFLEGNHYMGVNVHRIRTPDGTPFEIRFHTSESLAADTATRPLFEEGRRPETPRLRREQLLREEVEISARVRLPPGLAERYPPMPNKPWV